ncbi:MAG TPA: DUF177 domain-containing protein [Methylomirabilota bacterium]|nr:DUF177 domain-containing protein [Methylomirabilota bacterium]
MSGSTPFPLSRPQSVDNLTSRGIEVTIEASEGERAALAEILDIIGIDSLTATFTVKPWRKEGVKVAGVVSADVVQACVVTLEPVVQHLREEVEVTFLPGAEPIDPDAEIELDLDAPDLPEPLEGGRIDLGAIAAEHMALGLDPYPRAPGVEFNDLIEDDGSNDEPASPFADLARLKGEGET